MKFWLRHRKKTSEAWFNMGNRYKIDLVLPVVLIVLATSIRAIASDDDPACGSSLRALDANEQTDPHPQVAHAF